MSRAVRHYDPGPETFVWTSVALWSAGIASQWIATAVSGPIAGLLFAWTALAGGAGCALLGPACVWLADLPARRLPQVLKTRGREPPHGLATRTRLLAEACAASTAVAALAHFAGKVMGELGLAARWIPDGNGGWTALAEHAPNGPGWETVLGFAAALGIGILLPRRLMARRFRREQARLEPQ